MAGKLLEEIEKALCKNEILVVGYIKILEDENRDLKMKNEQLHHNSLVAENERLKAELAERIEIKADYTIPEEMTYINDDRFDQHIRNHISTEIGYNIARTLKLKEERFTEREVVVKGQLIRKRYSARIYFTQIKDEDNDNSKG